MNPLVGGDVDSVFGCCMTISHMYMCSGGGGGVCRAMYKQLPLVIEALNPLEIELQVAVSCVTRMLGMEDSPLNTEASLQPTSLLRHGLSLGGNSLIQLVCLSSEPQGSQHYLFHVGITGAYPISGFDVGARA